MSAAALRQRTKQPHQHLAQRERFFTQSRDSIAGSSPAERQLNAYKRLQPNNLEAMSKLLPLLVLALVVLSIPAWAETEITTWRFSEVYSPGWNTEGFNDTSWASTTTPADITRTPYYEPNWPAGWRNIDPFTVYYLDVPEIDAKIAELERTTNPTTRAGIIGELKATYELQKRGARLIDVEKGRYYDFKIMEPDGRVVNVEVKNIYWEGIKPKDFSEALRRIETQIKDAKRAADSAGVSYKVQFWQDIPDALRDFLEKNKIEFEIMR